MDVIIRRIGVYIQSAYAEKSFTDLILGIFIFSSLIYFETNFYIQARKRKTRQRAGSCRSRRKSNRRSKIPRRPSERKRRKRKRRKSAKEKKRRKRRKTERGSEKGNDSKQRPLPKSR